jgi:hypothetical protein
MNQRRDHEYKNKKPYSKPNVTALRKHDNSFSSKPSKTIYRHYSINLRLDPVENRIDCHSASENIIPFSGFNAFNSYFSYLLTNDGFSLPDIWPGYFHITVGNFKLPFNGNIERQEEDLVEFIKNNSSSEVHYASIFPCRFRTEGLSVNSGVGRFAEAQGIDFVTLQVNDLNGTLNQLRPLLEIIKNGVQKVGGQWERKSIDDYRNTLHVTVRKYEEHSSKWSSDYIRTSGIVESVQRNKLEFECIALDIVLPRRQAIKQNINQWWIGVKGTPLRCNSCGNYFPDDCPGCCSKCGCNGGGYMCSGCNQKSEKKWPGYCDQCGGYERLKPLWSTRS